MDCWCGLFKKKCRISETEISKSKPNFQAPHPLQLDLVVKCVLQFLPQNDIKSSRLVCQKWNLVAEPILRKRSTIVPPENFIEYNTESHFVDLAFSSFQLSKQIRKWNDSEWHEFCDLWLPKVKSLELHNIIGGGGVNTRHDRMLTEELLCGTPLLCLAKNLVELRVSDCSTPLLLPLDCLDIKILSLSNCSVIVHPNENTENRMNPWKISLQHIVFTLRNGNKLPAITINEFVDFANCSEIELVCSASDVTKITYDTLRDVTSARKIHLDGIRLLDKEIFHEKIEYVEIQSSSFFQVQEPDIRTVADITIFDNYVLLTKAIEKLSFPTPYDAPMNCTLEFIDLPNLKYLNIDATRGWVDSDSKTFLNVTDMDSKRNKVIISLYFFKIPQSCKRLKLSPAVPFKCYNMDHLIHDDGFLTIPFALPMLID